MEIAYEPHPVSPERKAELRAAGFKIIDARFAPEDAKPGADDNSIDGMTGPELSESLEAHGIEDIPHKVDERRELLRSVVMVDL